MTSAYEKNKKMVESGETYRARKSSKSCGSGRQIIRTDREPFRTPGKAFKPKRVKYNFPVTVTNIHEGESKTS